MLVVAHGNVNDYCMEHDLTIVGRYEGDLLNYRGHHPVIVTDIDVSKNEFYYLKYTLSRSRQVELVSTMWSSEELADFVAYAAERDRECGPWASRTIFGFRRQNGKVVEVSEKMAVVRRVFELRSDGVTLQGIRDNPDVRHPDGRKLSISTIQAILSNRDKYNGV